MTRLPTHARAVVTAAWLALVLTLAVSVPQALDETEGPACDAMCWPETESEHYRRL